jgi:hypothetical protein
MTTVEEHSTRRQRMILYIVVGAVIGALLVVGLVWYRSASSTQEAEAKADQLIAELDEAGAARIPNRDQLVRLLGEDGAVCANPNEALSRALIQSQLSTGAGGTGARPIISDDKVIAGTALVVEVYCPEELPAFQQYISQLQFADVAG